MLFDIYQYVIKCMPLRKQGSCVELFDSFRVAFDIIRVFELVQTTDLFDRTQARVSTNLKRVSR